MKSNAEISSLIEELRDADEQRIVANTTFTDKVTQVKAALREKAEAMVQQQKAVGKTMGMLHNRNTQLRGWVLAHHPATPQERSKWPAISNGYMLVVDHNWSFWFVERNLSEHNPEVEVTGEITKLYNDSPARIDHIWAILKSTAETGQETEQL